MELDFPKAISKWASDIDYNPNKRRIEASAFFTNDVSPNKGEDFIVVCLTTYGITEGQSIITEGMKPRPKACREAKMVN